MSAENFPASPRNFDKVDMVLIIIEAVLSVTAVALMVAVNGR